MYEQPMPSGQGIVRIREETVHSALILCALMGLLVGAVCFFFSGGMLKLLHTKDDLIEQASLYLKIYAIGLPAMGVYNFGNGILSARGDTKRPLYYLAAAGVLNVILNLFFVIVLHMAAAGVATATAIAQYVSAMLIMVHLLRRKDECHVSLKKIHFHKKHVLTFWSSVSRPVFKMQSSRLQTCLYRVESILLILTWFPAVPPPPMPTRSFTMSCMRFTLHVPASWDRIMAPEIKNECSRATLSVCFIHSRSD